MKALDYLRNGDVSRALDELKNEVRKAPQDAKHRIFLCQLFAVVGDWDRSLTQLNVARDLDPEALAMAQTYQEALQCEALRSRVFAGEKSPLVFGEPEPWLALFLEAFRHSVTGRHADAERLREEAFATAPAARGVVHRRAEAGTHGDDEGTGEPFEWIADADSRLGPVLEAIVNGLYYWIPFHRLQQVVFESPTDLRDLVWLPAHFTWSNGGEGVGFVPARYPGSEQGGDELRLGRKTEWRELSAGTFAGLGQRVLTTDAEEYPLLQIGKISGLDAA